LTVGADTFAGGSAKFGQSATIGQKLSVGDLVMFDSDAAMDGALSVAGNTRLFGDICGDEGMAIGGSISVGGSAVMSGLVSSMGTEGLFVEGCALMSKISIWSSLDIAGPLRGDSYAMLASVSLGGSGTILDDIYIGGMVEANDNVSISGLTEIGSDSEINESTTIANSLNVGSTLQVDGTISVRGGFNNECVFSVTSDGIVGGGLSVGKSLHVAESISAKGTVCIGERFSFREVGIIGSSMDVIGCLVTQGSLSVLDALNVEGDAKLAGACEIARGLAIGGSQDIEGQSSLRNPSGPCGLELLISGNAKHVVLMFSPKRKYFDHDPHWGEIPSVESEIEIIEKFGSKVIAGGIHTEDCTPEEAVAYQEEYAAKLNRPVLLPIQQGVEAVLPVLKKFREEKLQSI
jgi:predicted acyltransferase (DUF342 family)